MSEVAHLVIMDLEENPWLNRDMSAQEIADYVREHKIVVESICHEVYIPPAGNPDDRPVCEDCLAKADREFESESPHD